ncbi:MAG: hypothetical protein AABZ34_04520 [Nitrospirota bacterium]
MSTLGLLSAVEKVLADYGGVIIGGLITLIGALGGVILTNRAHDLRLQMQLAHDRELKNRDREMSLRKEVYLAAAEAISAGLMAVGRFANLEITHDKLTEDYQSKAASLAKINVVAKETTMRAVSMFSSELGATFLRLFVKRFPLIRQMQETAFLKGQIEAGLKEQTRILELIKQYNLDEIKDQGKWDWLQKSFDFERRHFEETAKKAGKLEATLYPNQLKFMEECAEETVRIARLLAPVIVSVRKELELPIDEVEYDRLLEEQIARQSETIREFSQQVQSLLASEAQPS